MSDHSRPASLRCPVRALLALGLLLFSHGIARAAGPSTEAARDAIVLPKSVPDPLEPFNRAMWGFNKGFMTGVIKPTSRVYRFVVVKPIRTGVGNFGRNLTYPARVINNLLQGRWTGARDETYRFLCNSTVGIAGFLDVGTKWKIPKADADFGQTLGQWGWKPGCYLMLPFLGPSNERDLVGFAGDTAVNPLLYIAPYEFDASNPLTWLGPYTYVVYAVMYNDLSDTVGEYVRFSRAEMDPYASIQYAWTFARAQRTADLRVQGEQDPASLETLASTSFTFKDSEFLNRGKTRSVRIPATGRKLKFTHWLQPGAAPVVYIVPGLGSHRLVPGAIALAELAYKNGFSAVCVSSAFHAEFMEHASTADVPGHLPVDARDLHVALTEIDTRLRDLYPQRLGKKALLGYSMGGFHSLYIAATESTNLPALIPFDRYVAIHAPVSLRHGITRLDEFYRAPLEWPAAERTANIDNAFLKVAALNKGPLTPLAAPPFSAIESKFLIGLTFRFTLRDIIYSTQRRNNQGVLQHRTRNWRRHSVYQEIMEYSYADYFEEFVIPHYEARGLAAPVAGTLEQAADLRTYEAALRAQPNLRLLINENDFLLTPEDLAWLRATFAPGRLTTFEHGGHLGNLATPAVQQGILDALGDLKPAVAVPGNLRSQ